VYPVTCTISSPRSKQAQRRRVTSPRKTRLPAATRESHAHATPPEGAVTLSGPYKRRVYQLAPSRPSQ
jgi:hypothetical protein